MFVLVRSLKALFPLLQLQRWVLSLLIILGVLTALSEGLSISLIVPLLQNQLGAANTGVTGKLSTLFQEIPAGGRIWYIGMAILACVVLKNILSYSYSLLFQWVNASINHRLRCGILHQLLSVSQIYLDRHDSGELLNTLGTETWRVSSAFTVLAGVMINTCITLILSILLFLISWQLTLLTACLLFLISQIIQLLTSQVKRLGAETTRANAKLGQRMLETFEGLRLIRLFGRELYEIKRFEEASRVVSKTFFQMDRVSGLVQPLSEVLTGSLLLGILVVTAVHAPGQIAVSFTFLILLYRLQPRTKQFDVDRASLDSLSASIEEVKKLLDQSDKPYLRGGTWTPSSIKNEIKFENVSLYYDSSNRPALEKVTCSIKLGETTAFVGPSGAGKSSLISLICRLYDPSSGRLIVDDVPLPQFDLAWWRSQIGVVSQDISLFNASVAENIMYGKLNATREELCEAARKAYALEFIEQLPDGFETVLGDRGIRLSGGQRQRLALARAFIMDPQILILDEATNSLDLISEHFVQDALEQFGRGRTVLIIAHRISTIENAENVIVLEAGRIVESGSVQQLLAMNGLFARFWSLQRRKHSDQDPFDHALQVQ